MEKVIVFGKGQYWHKKRKSVLNKYEVEAFIDNEVHVGEIKQYENVSVYSPDDIKGLKNSKIIIMSVRFFEMYEQLIALGVNSNRIELGINMDPAYDNSEKLLKKNGYKLMYESERFVLKNDANVYEIFCEDEYKRCLKKIMQSQYNDMGCIASLSNEPISRRFGLEHGTPIDRYYIEQFLYENKEYITGEVLEIADNDYTMKFGTNMHSNVLHVNGAGVGSIIKGNFETGEGIQENVMDCIICTQTLQMIYDVDTAVANMKKMLKQGGVLLLTTHGISQLSMYDYRNWGEYWRFTCLSLRKLLEKHFERVVKVESFGSVKTAVAQLYGLTIEDLEQQDFLHNDEQYPIIVCGIARKGY